MQLMQCFLMGGVRGPPDLSSGPFLYFIQLPISVILMDEAQEGKAYTSLRGMKVVESVGRSLWDATVRMVVTCFPKLCICLGLG